MGEEQDSGFGIQEVKEQVPGAIAEFRIQEAEERGRITWDRERGQF